MWQSAASAREKTRHGAAALVGRRDLEEKVLVKKGACYKRQAGTAGRSLPHHLLPLPLAPFPRTGFELRVANGETRQLNNILDTEIP